MNDNNKTNILIHKAFFSILIIESLFAFLLLAFRPSVPDGRFFLLYSAPLLLELFVILIITILSAVCMKKLADPQWREKLNKLVSSFPWNERLFLGGGFVFLISRTLIITLQVFAEGIDLHHLAGYAIHLQPISFLFSLIGFELALWVYVINKDNLFLKLGPENKYFNIAGIIWSLLSVISIFSVFLSKLQQTGLPYSPLFEWQIFLAWVLVTITILAFQQEERIFSKDTKSYQKQTFLIAIMVAIAAFLFHSSMQSLMRPYAIDNFYFQEWSSENMIQTVSLRDLIKNPLETLNNIHTKPPGFDAIRAFLVHLWPAHDNSTSLLHVDFLLYKLWTMLYSILGSLAYLWLSEIVGRKIAVITTFIILLHPASIQYSTLLDSNFLTVFLIFSLYYMLWRIKTKHDVLIAIVIVIVLALFLTRAIFQYPFIIVVGLSLYLLEERVKKILTFLLITGALLVIFGVKQYYQFGTISTSSFTGANLNRSVGNQNYTNYWNLDINYQDQADSLPETLTRTRKVTGSINYNHIQFLEYNQELIENYKEYMLATPVSQIMKSYWENAQIYFQPSSIYHTKHAIVDRLPWKKLYDQIFSSPILPLLLLLLGAYRLTEVVKQKDYLPSIGLLLPGLYVFLITILFEKGENMRFKFFIEPLLIIFIVTQLYEIRQNLSLRKKI